MRLSVLGCVLQQCIRPIQCSLQTGVVSFKATQSAAILNDNHYPKKGVLVEKKVG